MKNEEVYVYANNKVKTLISLSKKIKKRRVKNAGQWVVKGAAVDSGSKAVHTAAVMQVT